jgi:hypothetical protein
MLAIAMTVAVEINCATGRMYHKEARISHRNTSICRWLKYLLAFGLRLDNLFLPLFGQVGSGRRNSVVRDSIGIWRADNSVSCCDKLSNKGRSTTTLKVFWEVFKPLVRWLGKK